MEECEALKYQPCPEDRLRVSQVTFEAPAAPIKVLSDVTWVLDVRLFISSLSEQKCKYGFVSAVLAFFN